MKDQYMIKHNAISKMLKINIVQNIIISNIITKLINVFLYIRQLENFPIILIQPFKIVADFVSKFIATNYQNYPTPF